MQFSQYNKYHQQQFINCVKGAYVYEIGQIFPFYGAFLINQIPEPGSRVLNKYPNPLGKKNRYPNPLGTRKFQKTTTRTRSWLGKSLPDPSLALPKTKKPKFDQSVNQLHHYNISTHSSLSLNKKWKCFLVVRACLTFCISKLHNGIIAYLHYELKVHRFHWNDAQ